MTMALSGHGFAHYETGVRQVSCPKSKARGKYKVRAYRNFLRNHQIELMDNEIKSKNLEQFIFEFVKFPSILHAEMMEAGLTMHLLSGDGVAEDPTWETDPKTNDPEFDERNSTFDGRGWETVPGSGGAALPNAMIPTRIVVNKLYEGHGSINLVLHEHAHSLDSLYELRNISHSEEWLKIHGEIEVQRYLGQVCGKYCQDSAEESFAELFATYYACSAAHEQIIEEAPQAAHFIRNLRSAKMMLGSL
jgi:hypothetical protein